jgi:hypothetical protein
MGFGIRTSVDPYQDERRRLKPGVEAVPVDLRFDPSEDLVPDPSDYLDTNKKQRILQLLNEGVFRGAAMEEHGSLPDFHN